MAGPVDVPRTTALGWPTIDDLASYAGVPASDPTLIASLDGAIDYGLLVLGDRYIGPVMGSVFRACLDYAASIYTERIGQADVQAEAFFGSTSITRYRRILLANRYTAIA